MYGPVYFTIFGLTFGGGACENYWLEVDFCDVWSHIYTKVFYNKETFQRVWKVFCLALTHNISKHDQCIYGHVMYDTVIVS